MEMIGLSLQEAFADTWAMIPLMYVAYLVIEYFQRRSEGDDSLFWNLQKYGPAFGALLGLLPQCGFSILAALLFVQGNITLGTLLAVFIATSDEAIPVLISEPDMLPSLGLLLVGKLLLAMVFGFVVDRLVDPHQKILRFSDLPDEGSEEIEEDEDEAISTSCSCCYPQYPIWISALLRTLKIYLFVFLVTFIFQVLIGWIGEETLSKLLLQGSGMQVFLASLFGFIPNCAATVILCQLYAAGQLSFASLFAGLVSNAGMGLVVLFQYLPERKKLWKVVGLLLVASLLGGYGLMMLGF